MVDYAIFLQNKMHNPRDAEKYLTTAVKLHNNGVTNLQMGKFLSREHRYEDAIEYFSKVLRLNKERNNIYNHCNCVCYYEYGFALYKIKEYNKAQEMYVEALRIDKQINNGASRFAPKGTFKIYKQIGKKLNDPNCINNLANNVKNGSNNKHRGATNNKNNNRRKNDNNERKDNYNYNHNGIFGDNMHAPNTINAYNDYSDDICNNYQNNSHDTGLYSDIIGVTDRIDRIENNERIDDNMFDNINFGPFLGINGWSGNNSGDNSRDSHKTDTTSIDMVYKDIDAQEFVHMSNVVIGKEMSMDTYNNNGNNGHNRNKSEKSTSKANKINGRDERNTNKKQYQVVDKTDRSGFINGYSNSFSTGSNSGSGSTKQDAQEAQNLKNFNVLKHGKNASTTDLNGHGKESTNDSTNDSNDTSNTSNTSTNISDSSVKNGNKSVKTNDSDGRSDDDNNNDNINNNDDDDECKKGIDPLSEEFWIFWNNLPYFEPTKSKYYSKFVSNEWNCIAMIKLFTSDILMNEIGMNSIHSKLFENNVKRIDEEKKKFHQWLKSFEFVHEYQCKFDKIGVYSFASFHRRFKNVQSLIKKLKLPSNSGVIVDDCYEMWKNTPQYKRLQQMNKNTKQGDVVKVSTKQKRMNTDGKNSDIAKTKCVNINSEEADIAHIA